MKNLKLISFVIFCSLLSLACKNDASKNNAKEAVKEEAQVANETMASTYNIDPAASQITWTGSKPAGSHSGTIDISGGKLMVSNGNVIGGKFKLDMNSITVTDLDGDMKNDLEAHLKGTAEGKEDHFFNVAAHPAALFSITKVTSLQSDPEATHLVYGDLTIKGVKKNIGIKAKIEMGENSLTVSTPKFEINRTDYGIKFMSKSFFDDLKDKFINDEISLSLKLTAAK